ncbi:hypothetical protein NDU88_000392 [Pleurodeles waltl]|uniref:Uncharacterized protein n=1 Tax=Pleurodeles waltl TaxID=8319 RepID=A0AAV7S9Y3_PLEWA|nr:hypothetical protein NDU88_000392 [Pleurodeles waltl]
MQSIILDSTLQGLSSHPRKKLSRKFHLLSLDLATRPTHAGWLKDISEWTDLEEVLMKHVRMDEKVVDDLRAWSAMMHDLKEPPELANKERSTIYHPS